MLDGIYFAADGVLLAMLPSGLFLPIHRVPTRPLQSSPAMTKFGTFVLAGHAHIQPVYSA